MIRSIALLLAATASFATGSASAAIVTFDNLAPVTEIPVGYAGFTWTNLGVTAAATAVPTGKGAYEIGLKSGANILYSYASRTSTIASATAFTLNDAYFSGAFRNNLTVTAIGYNGRTQLYSTSFVVGTTAALLQRFDWTGLTSVTLTSSGGATVPGFYTGNQFVVDNLRVNEAVAAIPEPATWAMMSLGLGLVAAAARRRRPVAVAA